VNPGSITVNRWSFDDGDAIYNSFFRGTRASLVLSATYKEGPWSVEILGQTMPGLHESLT
jgi:hypothetical protein